MAPRHLGWKLEITIAIVFMFLTATWILGFANEAKAGEYEGEFHLAPQAEEIIKADGMVLWRIIDGSVRCYVVLTEARMIGIQSALSCVIPDKKEEKTE